MPPVNHAWAAKILGMNEGEDHSGPDLVDDDKIAEVKFRLVNPGYTHISWTVYEHQMQYGNGKTAFWALGTYSLSRPVSQINETDIGDLENLVEERKLWIVSWEWMQRFNSYPQIKRKNCNWYDSNRRYPKGSKLPPTKKEFKVEKGTIYLTEGVNPILFNIKTN